MYITCVVVHWYAKGARISEARSQHMKSRPAQDPLFVGAQYFWGWSKCSLGVQCAQCQLQTLTSSKPLAMWQATPEEAPSQPPRCHCASLGTCARDCPFKWSLRSSRERLVQWCLDMGMEGPAGFSPWFHLPGFHFGYLFLTHSHLNMLRIRFSKHRSGVRFPD